VSPVLPPATLGLLGGGQLGRFFVSAAHEMGYQVIVLDPEADCPAGRIADRHLIAAYDDPAALATLAAECAAVTTEFENVPAEALAWLASRRPVAPGPASVRICQDRAAEKGFLARHGIPHVPYAAIACADDLAKANTTLFPAILKTVRLGYDGKGQARVADRAAALAAFERFGGAPCVLEKMLPLDCEISVVLARQPDGSVVSYPPAENAHEHGILDLSIVPARIDPALADAARAIAERLAGALDYVGVLTVEFFVTEGQLLVNELAPRPHNSGHYTLDAAVTSQFEQQVRALCGLPLGETRLHTPAVMANLLGDLWFPAPGRQTEPDWRQVFAQPAVKLHLYGKSEPRPARKMGHLTAIGEDAHRALADVLAARAALSPSTR